MKSFGIIMNMAPLVLLGCGVVVVTDRAGLVDPSTVDAVTFNMTEGQLVFPYGDCPKGMRLAILDTADKQKLFIAKFDRELRVEWRAKNDQEYYDYDAHYRELKTNKVFVQIGAALAINAYAIPHTSSTYFVHGDFMRWDNGKLVAGHMQVVKKGVDLEETDAFLRHTKICAAWEFSGLDGGVDEVIVAVNCDRKLRKVCEVDSFN